MKRQRRSRGFDMQKAAELFFAAVFVAYDFLLLWYGAAVLLPRIL